MNFLERMRKQPKQVKAQYAFFAALSATLVIAMVWGVSLPARFDDNTNDVVKDDAARGGFRNLVDDAKDQLGTVIQEVQRDAGNDQAEPTDAPSNEINHTEEEVYMEDTDAVVDLDPSTSSATTTPTVDENVAESKPEPRVILIGTTSSKGTSNTAE